MKIYEAQKFVKNFVRENKWEDTLTIDKFDHIHEELCELSSRIRYRSRSEIEKETNENKYIFEDGIGDLLFATFRLCNQLGVDAEKSFEKSAKCIAQRYNGKRETKELNKSTIQ